METTRWMHCSRWLLLMLIQGYQMFRCKKHSIKRSSRWSVLTPQLMCELLLLRTLGQFHFTQNPRQYLRPSIYVPQRSWVCKCIASAAVYWPDGLFNFPIGHMRQTFCVKHKPLHRDTITTAFFFFYYAIMTGASCLKSMWLIASIQLYELCWHLSSFAMDHWKSWTWCVLICLCALCIVCRVFGLVVFCLRSPRGKWKGRNFSIQVHHLGLVETTVQAPPWSARKVIVWTAQRWQCHLCTQPLQS